MCKKKTIQKGFLLIELLVSLFILSVFLVTITGYIGRTFQWKQETAMRIKALNVAISSLGNAAHEKKLIMIKKQIDGFFVTITSKIDNINDQQNNKLLYPKGYDQKKIKNKHTFKTFLATVVCQSAIAGE
ncbi:prepilin-type N-terminal cleavage/methylation domain-containing protein, partial [bacterium]|nr:prepilin-type N-terminal cleavage/methylation domain-containing protein [bacterium]